VNRGEGVARRWRLNPPPNWPTLPDGWEPGPDWAPRREWGPAPVGWTLWRREGRGAWLARHRRTAGLGSAAALTIFVALAGPPATGTFQDAAPRPAQAAPSATGAAAAPLSPDRQRAEPVVRLQRRTPPASRERRPAAASAATTGAAIEPSAGPRDRRRKTVTAPGPSATTSAALCPPEESGASATPSASPGSDPFLAGEPGGCPGEGERIGFPRPTTSGSPDPPD